MSNNKKVAEAINLLGACWRGDWSDFDGRTLRSQLATLSEALLSDEPFDLKRWADIHGICVECRTWWDAFSGYCEHATADWEERRKAREEDDDERS